MVNKNKTLYLVRVVAMSPFLFRLSLLGALVRSCSNNADCSYLGQCDASTFKCQCNPGWSGPACDVLNLNNTIDYTTDGYHDGSGLSTWDGSPILDPDTGRYHLFISVLTEQCTASM